MSEPRGRLSLEVQEAERLGHTYIGCEHLLLGILANQEGPAARVLASHGVTLEAARRRTAEIVGEGGQDSVRWTSSPRANVVRRLAEVEAERLGEVEPTDAHTLLAMITEGEGVPMHLMAEFGVNVDQLREDLLDAIDVPDDERQTYLRQRRAYEHALRLRREGSRRE